MSEGGMHWSRPAGEGVLNALRRLGGQGTTFQLAKITGSLAVHSDVSSARMLCEDLGICSRDEAVECKFSRTTDAGRRVHFYTLSPKVLRALRAGALEGVPVQTDLF